ncbi:NAD(P)-dependent oxidoreductase [Nocardioides zeae]|uniref:NAD(P)-dependent oxidoreductase n=1 Tax=Nocardioides imazamoxiresistens TaxID=3231893 RepID=A0ABU3PSC4_9ACTN|nr:NAD(P)-dependent oxidoreductase [Nocardioides zeae]MDT9592091.1 NAD(P)-dependent oxidoreductase [Nocardioides zeae]
MTPGRVLRTTGLKPDLAATLAQRYAAPELPAGRAALGSDTVAAFGADAEIVVTSNRAGFETDLLDSLPRLRAVLSFGVGYDTIDAAALAEAGVVVSNTPDVLTDCVADAAVALALDAMRGFSAADRWVRAGGWDPGGVEFPLTRRLSRSRVGILGLGRIGRAIAHRLEAFGCSVSYHNRRELMDVSYPYAASPLDLARGVDLLVVAAAGGTAASPLVGREELEALGPGGFLVNVGRGSVVDEEALVDLLVDGGLGGAGLDVFASEPHVPTALRTLDNVVLLPHMASGTVETRADMARLVLENLDTWLGEGRLVTPVPESDAVVRS